MYLTNEEGHATHQSLVLHGVGGQTIAERNAEINARRMARPPPAPGQLRVTDPK